MAKHPLLSGLSNFLHQYSLLTHGERVLLAVSGGMDSVVLLDAMLEVSAELRLGLAVAHFNYQLRGLESDEDEHFVRALAARHGLECYVERANTSVVADTQKRSVQETARDLRYDFFAKLRTSIGFQKIATAHHADDNAETILFNLFRGAGLSGLSGISPHRKDIAVIRPLLFATREEIQRYAVDRDLKYREDSSNTGSKYTRNFIRHSVIPIIQEHINPNLVVTLQRTGDVFEQVEDFVQKEAKKLLDGLIVRQSTSEIVLNLTRLQDAPIYLQEYVIRHVAWELTSREIEHSAVRGILKVSQSDTGTTVSLPRESVCYRNRNELIFTKRQPRSAYRHLVQLNKEYDFEHFHFSSSAVPRAEFSKDPYTEFVDAASLAGDLALRPWSDGDAFVPLGMKEKKKVSDFFVDEKIPLFEKQIVPILVSDENIVWICGKRLDDRFKVTPKTTSIVRLEYHPRS